MRIWSLVLFGVALLTTLSTRSTAATRAWRQDRFLVTFWCPPPATDESLRTVARDGYNLTWTPEAGLDVARRQGLRSMLQDPLLVPSALDDPAQRAKLDALIARVKGHPALEAYYLTDEPSAAAFAELGRLVAYLRERDPAHLAFINLFPTYANNAQLGTAGDTVAAYREHLRQYVAAVRPDLISYDHYHFFKERDGDQYFLNLAMIRDAALAADRPFLNIIQACTIEKVWRLVNADELRFLVFTTLAYGGRGISYFLHTGPVAYGGLYQDGVRMPLADEVRRLNQDLVAFGPELMRLHSRGVYQTAPLPRGAEAVPATSPIQIRPGAEVVLGLFSRQRDGSPGAFLVANRRYDRETNCRLDFDFEWRRLEEFDRATARWQRVEAPAGGRRSLEVALRRGDGRLFRWVARR